MLVCTSRLLLTCGSLVFCFNCKSRYLKMFAKQITKSDMCTKPCMFKYCLSLSKVLLLSQKQSLEELKQMVQVLHCSEVKLSSQKEMLEHKMQENEGKEPPTVVNYEEDARSINSMVCLKKLFFFYLCQFHL